MYPLLTELAVGAPMAEDGVGYVYLYCTVKGPFQTTPCQVRMPGAVHLLHIV